MPTLKVMERVEMYMAKKYTNTHHYTVLTCAGGKVGTPGKVTIFNNSTEDSVSKNEVPICGRIPCNEASVEADKTLLFKDFRAIPSQCDSCASKKSLWIQHGAL